MTLIGAFVWVCVMCIVIPIVAAVMLVSFVIELLWHYYQEKRSSNGTSN